MTPWTSWRHNVSSCYSYLKVNHVKHFFWTVIYIVSYIIAYKLTKGKTSMVSPGLPRLCLTAHTSILITPAMPTLQAQAGAAWTTLTTTQMRLLGFPAQADYPHCPAWILRPLGVRRAPLSHLEPSANLAWSSRNWGWLLTRSAMTRRLQPLKMTGSLRPWCLTACVCWPSPPLQLLQPLQSYWPLLTLLSLKSK